MVKRVSHIGLLALVVALLGSATLYLFNALSIQPILWLTDGVALVAMLLNGTWLWPGVLIGTVAALLSNAYPPVEALGFACISTASVLFCHALLRRYWRIDPELPTMSDFLALLWTSLLGGVVAALPGTVMLYLDGNPQGSAFTHNFVRWWQSTTLGFLLMPLLLLTWRKRPTLSGHPFKKVVTCCLCLGLALIFGQAILVGGLTETISPLRPTSAHASDYWLFFFVIWAAIGCGRRVAILIVTLYAVQGLVGVINGLGLFAEDRASNHLMNYWFFVMLQGCIGFALATLLSENEQKREDLTRSRQFSDDLLESLPGNFYLIDALGRMKRWNSTLSKVTGYSDEELSDMPSLELVSKPYRKHIEEEIGKVFQTGQTCVEAELLTKSGKIIPYRFTGRRTWVEGAPYLVGLGEDISEEQKTRQELLESEARLRMVFDTADIRIIIFDLDGIILLANDSRIQTVGRKSSDLVGHSIYDLVAPNELDKLRERYTGIMKSGQGAVFEDYHQTPNGDFWFSSQIDPARNASGEIYGIQIVAINITERKKAEKELQSAEALWKFALEGSGSAVWDMNVATGEVKYTARWWEILGYDGVAPENDPGWQAHLHPDDKQRAKENTARLFDGETVTSVVELRMRCKDGSYKWVMTHGMVVERDEQNQPLRIVGTVSDITERKQAELALRDSERRYRALFESGNIHTTIFDLDGRILMTNEASARSHDLRPEEMIGKTLFELDPNNAQTHLQRFREVARTGETINIEESFPLKDGLHWFSTQIQPIALEKGEMTAIQAVAFDITERRRMEDALRKSEELWKFALEGSGDSVWDWDVEHNNVILSQRWKEQLGYAPGDDTGAWFEHVHPEDVALAEANNLMLRSGVEPTTSIELRLRRKDGRYCWMLARGMVASRDESGNPTRIIGTNTDITPLKEHQQQLEHIAHYDALTDLPNRLLLSLRLQQAVTQSQRRNQSLAVVYLDLDGFKEINDQHGHDIGDELLVVIAQRMKSALREGDTLARIGGDEFIAVLTDLNQPQDCEPVLHRLLQAASLPATIADLILNVSASNGVTIYPGDGADADQLIRHADQAMYQAKQAGKNRFQLFDVEHDAKIQQKHEGLESIRAALKRGEFILHYQPKVNMTTGEVVGVEALIRWQHPERGLLSPAQFLPLAESHELKIKIGEWVIETALRQSEEWQRDDLNIPISVNIDAYHLQYGNFVEGLRTLLAAYPKAEPSSLNLEILETNAFEDLEQVSGIMRACRALGVSFALDDFGTGYASLTYLKWLPAKLLKIDQSFVRDMLDDPDDLAIVESVIGLAHAFQRHTIAEGVETIEHGEMLLQLGCELAQGYGIAKPMPPSALAGWIQQWHPDTRWQAWRNRTVDRNNLPAVFARVRHRYWLHALAHQHQDASGFGLAECPLTHWQKNHGHAHYGALPAFAEVTTLHHQLHELGQKLSFHHQSAEISERESQIKQLFSLHDDLQAALQQLLNRS